MDDLAAPDPTSSGRWKVLAVALVGLVASLGAGWALVGVVDALEPDECGAGGYGGYGCEEPVTDGTITVVPDTDLVDRQIVAINGSKFDPNTSFGAAQCDPALLPTGGTGACDLSTSRLTTTDATGSVSFTMPVRRIITVQGTDIDCALSPCVIGAATLSGGTTPIEGTSAPISFDPNVPPVPDLSIDLTVDDVGVGAVAGTVTCNREAEAFLDAFVSQHKAKSEQVAYGFSGGPVACGPEPTEWSVQLTEGFGRLTGGPATYDVSAYAYDGFEDAFEFASGETRLSGGGQRTLDPSSQQGETVSLEILGSTRTESGLSVELRVTCDRAVPIAEASVTVRQWAGLDQVAAFGDASIGPCDGVVDVSVPVTAITGTLAGGPADVFASVQVLDFDPPDEFYDFATANAPVRLSGNLRPPPIDPVPVPGSRLTITGVTVDALTGTVECDEATDVELWTEILQTRGRTVSGAFGYDVIPCDGVASFWIPLDGELRSGEAAAFLYASGYRELSPDDYEYVWDDQQAASLRVRR